MEELWRKGGVDCRSRAILLDFVYFNALERDRDREAQRREREREFK